MAETTGNRATSFKQFMENLMRMVGDKNVVRDTREETIPTLNGADDSTQFKEKEKPPQGKTLKPTQTPGTTTKTQLNIFQEPRLENSNCGHETIKKNAHQTTIRCQSWIGPQATVF